MVIAILKRNFTYLKKIIIISGIGAIVALPQIIYLTAGNSALTQAAGFIVPRLGWMVPSTIGSVTYPRSGALPTIFSFSFLQFMLINFGVILPTFFACLIKILLRKNIFEKNNFLIVFSFALSGLMLFIIVELIKFQPWDFDDNKLLIYFQFFAIPVILLVIKDIYSRVKFAGIFIAVIFIGLALFSGAIDMIPRLAMTSDTLPIKILC